MASPIFWCSANKIPFCPKCSITKDLLVLIYLIELVFSGKGRETPCFRMTLFLGHCFYVNRLQMPRATSQPAVRQAWLLAWLVLIAIVVGFSIQRLSENTPVAQSDATTSDSPQQVDGSIGLAPGQRFATTIRQPEGPPVIELTQVDPQGRTGQIACSTCHSVREPDLATREAADLKEFHGNMTFSHGKLACYACHNAHDADTLHLADSTVIAYSDVMTLCAQCHGPQARDYEHGAHGGMTGYWDLSRGPRTRNHCVDCHDPHSPQFPRMIPTFKPHDRFLEAEEPHSADTAHE
jgi:nitrate reductase cytochrome c-type subunit